MNPTALRAAALIASVYGYFLIFAQFSFVELIRSNGIRPGEEKLMLGAMALAGIVAGFAIAWKGVTGASLRIAMAIAGTAAAAAPFLTEIPFALAVSVLTGAALGVATVSLATLLRGWCGIFWVGLGTGLGYAVCNLPWIFQASPEHQAWIGAGLALFGIAAVPKEAGEIAPAPRVSISFRYAVLVFTALVWMDSAVFFIIQHTSGLKEITWGDGLLWRNSAVHFLAAIFAGWWLAKSNSKALPVLAWLLLATASLALGNESTKGLAAWLYPAGVSLYSTALVAWPGWFSGARNKRQVAYRAATLFGIAGWFGSANGIGMAQSLHEVPHWFIAVAGIAIVGGTFFSENADWRVPLVVSALVGIFLLGEKQSGSSVATPAERGKQVYIAEGCINCHSQYIRPGSPDEIPWGPASTTAQALSGKPVLIGNRRNGPDLSNIGLRRSRPWLKAHFIDPQAFAKGSAMPSYPHLFDDSRGDDLIAYLSGLGMENFAQRQAQINGWQPPALSGEGNGGNLFVTHCAACHGETGTGNGAKSGMFARPPANLIAGPFAWSAEPSALPRIIRFGIPGTDMPGHETLADGEIAELATFVLRKRGK